MTFQVGLITSNSRWRRYLLLALLVVGLCFYRPAYSSRASVDAVVAFNFLQSRYGEQAAALGRRWLKELDGLQAATDDEKLRAVNLFWNTSIRESEDIQLWQQEDYWATPLETLGRQAGDCEDYVIGKYFSLRYLGVPADKLRLIYVKATVAQGAGSATIAHMVLGYYSSPDADPLVLDSLVNTIDPGSKRVDLAPVFSFNAEGIFVAGKQRATTDRIGRWSALLESMTIQGLRL